MPHLIVSRVRLAHVVVLIRQENTGCSFSSSIRISESRSSAVFSFLQVRSSSGAVIKGTNNQQTRVISPACWAEIKNGMRTVWSDLEERAGGGQGEGITALLLINSMRKKRRRCPLSLLKWNIFANAYPLLRETFRFYRLNKISLEDLEAFNWLRQLPKSCEQRLNLLFRNFVVIAA